MSLLPFGKQSSNRYEEIASDNERPRNDIILLYHFSLLNLSILDIPHVGGEALDKVTVMDYGENRSLEISQCLLEARP